MRLRPCEAADARFVYEVNNHPSTRAQSRSTRDIPWEEHVAWLERKLADPRARVWIACADGEEVGVIRVEAEGSRGEISLAVHPARRGRGHGGAMIRQACEDLRSEGALEVLVAVVRPDNEASRRAFERSGFSATGRHTAEGVELLSMQLDLAPRRGAAYGSAQEQFWAGRFGDEYSERNRGGPLLASKIALFARALSKAAPIRSVLELGANVGMNLEALHLLLPRARLAGIEINEAACRTMAALGYVDARHGSLLDAELEPGGFDLVFTAGVLIHVDPARLDRAYEQLHRASARYVLVAEYYNPTPVAIPYRGHEERLFKRDFAGEVLDRFADTRLVDYGFQYRRDPLFPADDLTWFLLEKTSPA